MTKDSQNDSQINHSFLLEYDDLISQINRIDTREYGKTRNFIDGAVSKLSPFITHGVITTRQIAKQLLTRELSRLLPEEAYRRIEPFLFQMAWRDYFHRAWEFHQDDIFSNLNHEQSTLLSEQIPTAILKAETGIEVIDQQLQQLYQTGYIHNHSRMWIAAFVANITGTDWRNAATWFHYHLLDGDLASNTLSWQWVAGTLNKNKKHYIANQDNINKYGASEQSNTILDRSYDEINAMMPFAAESETGDNFSIREDWQVDTLKFVPDFIATTSLDELDINTPVYLRNFYQLDQAWHLGEGQHILLIEPAMLKRFPLSANRWRFIEHWALKIPSLQVVVANFEDLHKRLLSDSTSSTGSKTVYQDHPLSTHWKGQCENRTWFFDGLEGEYSSFFKFWNKAQKQVKNLGVIDAFKLGSST